MWCLGWLPCSKKPPKICECMESSWWNTSCQESVLLWLIQQTCYFEVIQHHHSFIHFSCSVVSNSLRPRGNIIIPSPYQELPRWLSGKESICPAQETGERQVQSLVRKDPQEEETTTFSSSLVYLNETRIPWRIPWTEEPGGL